jgi:integrase
MQVWNGDEIMTFLEAAKSTPYHALFFTALYTGLRRSEVLALRWSDIDLLLCQLYVNRSVHQLKDGSIIYRQPKSAKSRRMVSLSPSTALLLQEHKDSQAALREMIGIPLKEDDLVFCTLDGAPIRPNTVTRAWPMLAAKAGVKPIRFHDARHTHASLMLKQGVHPKIVSERLGHTGIAITLDTYSHVSPGLQEKAALSFDEALGYNGKREKSLT